MLIGSISDDSLVTAITDLLNFRDLLPSQYYAFYDILLINHWSIGELVDRVRATTANHFAGTFEHCEYS